MRMGSRRRISARMASLVMPEHGVEAAVEHEPVAVFLFHLDRVHARLDFHRVQRVEADGHDFGQQGVYVAAGVQAHINSFLLAQSTAIWCVGLMICLYMSTEKKAVPL